MQTYYHFCETLWQQWLHDQLVVTPPVAALFQLDYAPEPYHYLGDETRSLCIVTTNPGGGLPYQHKSTVTTGASLLKPDQPYQAAAHTFDSNYTQYLPRPASARISAMLSLAAQAGYSGVLQLESIPFHSKYLPNKHVALQNCLADPFLRDYTAALQDFLAQRTVFILAAIGSHQSLTPETLRLSPWLTWQAALIGLRLPHATLYPIVHKEAKVTAALLVDRHENVVKSVFLMMGGNHLPNRDGIERMAAHLQTPS